MVENLLERLTALADTLSAIAIDKRELKDRTLRAISIALNETYLYYQQKDMGHKRNPETEAQLSRYWAAAAIPIRHFDANLAEICVHKSDYWVNPESWDETK